MDIHADIRVPVRVGKEDREHDTEAVSETSVEKTLRQCDDSGFVSVKGNRVRIDAPKASDGVHHHSEPEPGPSEARPADG